MNPDVIIIGAGPAGLTAAYELIQHNRQPLVLEKRDKVGGIARTEEHQGYRFDMGGHRFYTKVKEIDQLWHDMLGENFIKVPRLSRIFYQGKFYNYPLQISNTLKNLGIIESGLILLSYVKSKILPHPKEDTFEEWVSNRFGRRLFHTFFQTYTEKVWGIPCNQIRADWAAQRIKNLSLRVAVQNALFGGNGVTSLIDEFDYPVLGPGMMWERFQQVIDQRGGTVQLNANITRICREQFRITGVQLDSHPEPLTAPHYISSMPLTQLILRLDPPAPQQVRNAAQSLSYRAFILIGLVVDHPDLFPDNWIYIHSPEVKVGRIQNFKNWSLQMVPDLQKTSIGMEYFCDENDELWRMADEALIDLAGRELAELGLAKGAPVHDGVVFRQPKAYPVYDDQYRQHVETIRRYLSSFENLQTIGRNGMHRYNNQDHSMLTGLLAVQNLVLGTDHDLWEVNTERSYYEEFQVGTKNTMNPAS